MDVGAAFGADAEASVLVKPGDGALDDPAFFAESGAVLGALSGDRGADAAGSELAAVAARLVGAVAKQPFGATTRPASFAAHWRDSVDQRQQLEDVVPVPAVEGERERGAASAGQRMVLGTAPGAVNRAWSRLLAPPTARTCELSITAPDQSIRPA
jgi:hypothetical protein